MVAVDSLRLGGDGGTSRGIKMITALDEQDAAFERFVNGVL